MLNIKEYLSQAHRIDQRINSKLEQVISLRALAEKAASTMPDIPKRNTRNISRMEDVIVKMVDLEAEINADIDALVDFKREIIAAIKRLDNTEYQTLLELRYLCFMRWEAIAVELSYSPQHMFRLHDAAIKAIDLKRNVKHESK
jgi:DNA-directed RNA polymerase specialized sigma subunit